MTIPTATIERSALLAVLKGAGSVTKPIQNFPMLAHCKIELSNNNAQITATDFDLTFRSTIDADVAISVSIRRRPWSGGLPQLLGLPPVPRQQFGQP